MVRVPHIVRKRKKSKIMGSPEVISLSGDRHSRKTGQGVPRRRGTNPGYWKLAGQVIPNERKGCLCFKIAGHKKIGPTRYTTKATFSMTKDTWRDLDAAIETAKNLGASFFSYAPISPFGKAEETGWTWDASEAVAISDVEHQAFEKHQGFLTEITEEMRESVDQAGNCGAGYKNVTLSPTGKIRACSFMAEKQYLGDVKKNSLLEIFDGPTMQYLHDIRQPSEEICAGCRHLAFCGNCWFRPRSVMLHEGRVCKWAVEMGVIGKHGYEDMGDIQPGGEVFPWGR